MAKKISKAERRRQDALRLGTLRTAGVYERRLARNRRKELRRVLAMARDIDDPVSLPALLQSNLNESGYLTDWWSGLWLTTGKPVAESTAQDLARAKAAAAEDIWISTLRRYALERAGAEIVAVTGTWKRSLVSLLSEIMLEDVGNMGIEKITRELFERYTGDLERWQCRRIAQTEAMIGAADAADLAAAELDVNYTKQWCISGLGNTRETHEAMDGVTVDRDELFQLPDCMMRYPHDTLYNPPAGEIINCACSCIRRPTGASSRATNASSTGPAPTPIKTPEQIREEMVQAIMKEKPTDLPEAARRKLAEHDLEIEKALGVKKGAPMTLEQADTGHANPHYSESYAYHENCATCSPTYMLRKNGFDVTAKPYTDSKVRSLSTSAWKDWLNIDGTSARPEKTLYEWGAEKGYTRLNAARYMEYVNEMASKPGVYEMHIPWKGGKRYGHSFIIQRMEDGRVVAVDAQTGKFSEELLKEYLAKGKTANFGWSRGLMRIDDKLFNPEWLSIFSK